MLCSCISPNDDVIIVGMVSVESILVTVGLYRHGRTVSGRVEYTKLHNCQHFLIATTYDLDGN